MLKLLTIPLSWIYAIGVAIRNKMFDMNILKIEEYDIPIVCVGNISVGGTGKTPHTELLIRLLSSKYNVAVISRGYKRKSKGYLEVREESSAFSVGDEPKQIKRKFPHVHVAVCEKRKEGINTLRRNHPEINLIIMDDGFQHRYVETWLNIIITDHANPIYEDHILPWGRLRESRSSLSRAQIVITSKMPTNVKPIEMRLISKSLNLYPYQSIFFTRMVQKLPVQLFTKYEKFRFRESSKIIALSAIAKPESFIKQLSKRYNVVDSLSFADHHNFHKKDLNLIAQKIQQHGANSVVIMTEKDAVKFMGSSKIPDWIASRMYMIPIEVEFVEADITRNNTIEHFIERVMPYVQKNQKYNVLNR